MSRELDALLNVSDGRVLRNCTWAFEIKKALLGPHTQRYRPIFGRWFSIMNPATCENQLARVVAALRFLHEKSWNFLPDCICKAGRWVSDIAQKFR